MARYGAWADASEWRGRQAPAAAQLNCGLKFGLGRRVASVAIDGRGRRGRLVMVVPPPATFARLTGPRKWRAPCQLHRNIPSSAAHPGPARYILVLSSLRLLSFTHSPEAPASWRPPPTPSRTRPPEPGNHHCCLSSRTSVTGSWTAGGSQPRGGGPVRQPGDVPMRVGCRHVRPGPERGSLALTRDWAASSLGPSRARQPGGAGW